MNASILNAFLSNLKDIFQLVSKSHNSPMLYHAPGVCWVFFSVEISAPSFPCPLCAFPAFWDVWFFPRVMLINSEFPALSELNQNWWIQSRAKQLNCQFLCILMQSQFT